MNIKQGLGWSHYQPKEEPVDYITAVIVTACAVIAIAGNVILSFYAV